MEKSDNQNTSLYVYSYRIESSLDKCIKDSKDRLGIFNFITSKESHREESDINNIYYLISPSDVREIADDKLKLATYSFLMQLCYPSPNAFCFVEDYFNAANACQDDNKRVEAYNWISGICNFDSKGNEEKISWKNRAIDETIRNLHLVTADEDRVTYAERIIDESQDSQHRISAAKTLIQCSDHIETKELYSNLREVCSTLSDNEAEPFLTVILEKGNEPIHFQYVGYKTNNPDLITKAANKYIKSINDEHHTPQERFNEFFYPIKHDEPHAFNDIIFPEISRNLKAFKNPKEAIKKIDGLIKFTKNRDLYNLLAVTRLEIERQSTPKPPRPSKKKVIGRAYTNKYII